MSKFSKGFTYGDYQSILRHPKNKKYIQIDQNNQADKINDDLEIFLLDFYPFDEYRVRKLYQEQIEAMASDSDSEDDEMEYDENLERYVRPQKKQKKRLSNNFMVRIFGLARDKLNNHYSISIDLQDFQPFFFIKIPDDWKKIQLETLIERIKTEAQADPNSRFDYSRSLIKYEIVIAKPFYGYTANDKFQYAKLVFSNSSGFGSFRRLFEHLKKKKPDPWAEHQLYESNIEPMLRLAHIQEIIPSGWVRISKEILKKSDSNPDKLAKQIKTSDCQLHYQMSYRDLIPMSDCMDIPPIQVASYDIECDSSHGDFPIASKNFQKLAQDIVTEFLKLPKDTHRNQMYQRALIHSWITLAFEPYYDNNNINRVITINDEMPEEEDLDYLIEVTKKIADQYHQSVMDIIKNGFEPNQVKGYQDFYITKLALHLEMNLPELDLDRCQVGNYRLLAEQLIKENHRMLMAHQPMYLKSPEESIKFWIKLAFHPYYDNHNINKVHTHQSERPSIDMINNLIPQVYAICCECYQHLNKKKEKKKPVPKIGPKKMWSQPPTDKGQTKLSQFLKKKKTDQPVLKSTAPKAIKEAKKMKEAAHQEAIKKHAKKEMNARFNRNQTPEHQLTRGRYVKPKPEPYPDPDDSTKMKTDKIGRDFYVKWMHELFDLFLPEVVGDPCIQIGTTFKRYGEKELFLKHIITLKGCAQFTNENMIDDENRDIFITSPKAAIEEAKKLNLETPLIQQIKDRLENAKENNIKKPEIPELEQLNHLLYVARRNQQMAEDNAVLVVECYEKEADVLLAWKRLIKETDPDVITGYNIFGFDFKYMWDRAEVLGILEEFRDLGRVRQKPEELIEKKLVSSGLGDNLLYFISMTGRVVIDLLKVVQSGGYRLPIYKLDFVCNHFLYKRKNDLPPQQIFIMQKGSDKDRAKIARYCLVDCILCNRLIDKLEIITNNVGMSRVCKIPLSYLFLRGQGIKIQSLISDITRKEGFLIKAKDRDMPKGNDWFEGAIVLDPAKGIYFEASVVADFNSLYPSCMIAWNLSHDSWIELGGKYDNLPEGQYYDVQYDDYRVEKIPGRKATRKVKVGVKTCRFYQPPDGSKSMIPRIEQTLLAARKKTRKEQKKFVKGTFEWNVKEGLQLAYKVTANSLYGQVGAKTSAVSFKEIAACTTACGRGLIYKSKDFVEENYQGAQTIYGDSVTGDTVITTRDHDGYIDIRTIESLSQDWQPYEDFKTHETTSRVNKQQSKPYQDDPDKYLEVWSSEGWSRIKRVIRHQTTKDIYQVSTSHGIVKVTEDHSLLREDGTKLKPIEVDTDEKLLHGFSKDHLKIRPELEQKYFSIPNLKYPDLLSNFEHSTSDPIEAQYIYTKLKSIFTTVEIKTVNPPDQSNTVYQIIGDHLPRQYNLNQILDIKYVDTIEHDAFVYDLETEQGNFHAGIGGLVISNTDSIFVKFVTKNIRGEQLYGLDAIYKNIELCTEASLGISRTLPSPHNLEFEKAIWPFMLMSKKRYHGHYYTVYGKPSFYPNSMGIVLKRRDNAAIVKHIFGGVLDIIMEEHDIEKAVRFCKEESQKLLEGKFPLEMFTITKTLKSYYKNPDQIAHNVLAMRIAERDPGNKPQSNDRMAFAYIKVPEPKKGEKVLQGDRIETPEFIKENNLELDYRFYLTNQVMKPVTQIFELVMDEKELAGIFGDSLMEYDRRQSGIQRITKFVTKTDDPYEHLPATSIIDKLLKEIHQEQDKENQEEGDFQAKDGDEVASYNNN